MAWCTGNDIASPRVPIDLCPHGKAGDLLWVKEPLEMSPSKMMGPVYATYIADGKTVVDKNGFRGRHSWPWKNMSLPARYCPRKASRCTLRLTKMRVERVQDISEGDAIREGFYCAGRGDDHGRPDAFSTTWERLHGESSWDENPWVFVEGFEVAS